MKTSVKSIAAALAILSMTPSFAEARQTASADQIYMILNPGKSQRAMLASGPEQRISLRNGEVLLVLYPDDRSAQYAGPFTGTLAEARSREVASQSVWNRMFNYLRQTREELRRAGTRTSGAPRTWPAIPLNDRAEISDLDDLPPISVRARGPQCVARGQGIKLWRDAAALEEQFSMIVGGRTTVVTFPVGERVVEWPIDRPERFSGQTVEAVPPPLYDPKTFTLVAIEANSGPGLLSALSEAGCDQQAQSVMDFIWRTESELAAQ